MDNIDFCGVFRTVMFFECRQIAQNDIIGLSCERSVMQGLGLRILSTTIDRT